MVPTEVVRRDLLANGFAPAKVVLWSRGVDLDIFKPGPAMAHDLTHADLPVRRPRRRREEHRGLPAPRPARQQVGRRRRAGAGEAEGASFPRCVSPACSDQAELATLYNAADVFVFPSRTDTFGLVLLEAMACGCPVAAYPGHRAGGRDRRLAGRRARRGPARRLPARADDRPRASRAGMPSASPGRPARGSSCRTCILSIWGETKIVLVRSAAPGGLKSS